ncbi:hypothetical protein FIV42_28985 [Persicimonas caeni]|uniref:Uncharacterized protein n=1 Tax=Persicimonas caeni TaxID=2292766 RepID=A0A4Y6Q3R8_PERCE|nr:putative metal-binding motif-containing protein [Persicimonas caeni]QDG54635.1 hypothetical protein FIV42_28985 [Persicimonas caeni]QED35856.1 hypothetical protein FRD00_28980 [Persicimonas caeni]
MSSAVILAALVLVAGVTASCTSENPGQSDGPLCTSDEDCNSGTCEDGTCTIADAGLDADNGDADRPDDAGDDGGNDVGDPGDGGGTDADVDDGEDAGDVGDATDSGDATDADGGASQARSLADYRTCTRDADCPTGLGVCVKSVPLNRADSDGRNEVPLTEIFEELADGEGVCSYVCTNNPGRCDELSMNGNEPDVEPHTCQLVFDGEAPYPEQAPAFPFDDQLDPAEMEANQPFGAICRPPFGLDEAHAQSFCSTCSATADCGQDALCYDRVSGGEIVSGGEGVCVSACAGDADCPMGFACDVSDTAGNTFCRPTIDTCTVCRDRDGDGLGTGRCGTSATPVTRYDCDDRNAEAYYNPDIPDHPFPQTCGEQDYNCNGLSDTAEQVGADQYPAEHCTACFDTCSGQLTNGAFSCKTETLGDGSLQPFCGVQCDAGWADCDGDSSNGCEVPVDDPTRVYYRDADGDGRGDPNDSTFACTPGDLPAGYVQDDSDCNDAEASAYGAGPGGAAAEEVCDGVDNDCNGSVDDALAQEGTSCSSTGNLGVCADGFWVCKGTGGFACEGGIQPGSQLEVCNGLDDDCDGDTDEATATDAQLFYPDRDSDGYGDSSASSTRACSAPSGFVLDNSDCNDSNSNVNPGETETCATGYDDNCNGNTNDAGAIGGATLYRDADGDGYGVSSQTEQYCSAFSGWATQDGDCADSDSSRNPGATEVCDDVDNNCDGTVDEAGVSDGLTWYPDDDGDTHGDANHGGTRYCSGDQPSGWLQSSDDCNDNNDQMFSGNFEQCDGLDNDCDGDVDEGCPSGLDYPSATHTTRWAGQTSGDLQTVTCPDDTFVDTIEVNWSDEIGYIGMRCVPVRLETDQSSTPYGYDVGQFPGSLMTTVGAGAHYSFGTTPLGPMDSESCPNKGENGATSDQFVTGIQVVPHTDGDRIVQVGPLCADSSISTNPGTEVNSTLSISPTPSAGRLIGTSSGGSSPSELRCPTGQVVAGFKGYFNEIWVNFGNGPHLWSVAPSALSLICKEIALTTR